MEKIDACKNGCMLFWGDDVEKDMCDKCGESRWKSDNNCELDDCDQDATLSKKKRPVKVLRYLPFIPRLQRLFMSSKTSQSMTWHEDGRTKYGMLRHPADGDAWIDFNQRYPDFAVDKMNIRLTLATDASGDIFFAAMFRKYQ
uniref:Uncharacterized protein n=1 Tax=Nelumbo nucifera TaxID=4432 RepID=A0A822YHK0_NELNU|nr:TPA_asm: hypothetical protein HUJ06_010911 [Nelumbo nucifera]